jgi:spoIIIJ-associated protein
VVNQRFEGKSLDEALTQAAEALGVERYQLTYHVVLEKRGFLGGTKRVVIEAEINRSATDVPEPQPPSVAAQPPSPRGRSRREGRSRDRRRGGRNGRRGSEHIRSHEYDDLPPVPREPTPEQGPQSEQAILVREWCERIVDLAGFDLDVRTEESGPEITVLLFGRDSVRLTERSGELLDSLQVLANKALMGRKVDRAIEFNCGGFKERRLEDLEHRARELAQRVRVDGREQMLPSMSPIERRIVHLALRDDAEVTTQSRGDGFYKRVAIIPRPEAGAEPPSESESP